MRSTLRLTPSALWAAVLLLHPAATAAQTVTVIDASDAVYTDVADLLQGRIAGLLVTDTDGQVGAASAMRIRGNGSINLGNHPLVYVDGVRIENVPLLDVTAAGVALSALDAINPEEIERIEVVRGPTASVLYGPDAASGVILITTGTADVSGARWSLTMDGGMGRMGHMGPAHASDVTSISNAYTDAALPTGDFDVDYLLDGDINPSGLNLNDCRPDPSCPAERSWIRDARLQRYNLGVRGGSDAASYFVSGRWTREEGVIRPQERQGYNLRGNIQIRPNESVDFTFRTAYGHRGTGWIPGGNYANSLLRNVIQGSNGGTPHNLDDLVLFEQIESSIDHWLGGGSLLWRPTATVSQRFNAGFSLASGELVDLKPYGHFTHPSGMREVDLQQYRTFLAEYAGRWGPTVGRLDSSFEWGFQYIDRRRRSIYLLGENFPGPLFGEGWVGQSARNVGDEERSRSRILGIFLQSSFDIGDRISLSAGVRWDDFSTLGPLRSLRPWGVSTTPNGPFAGFTRTPRLSAAYRISEEDFFGAVPLIDDLLLRVAWGRASTGPLEPAHEPIYGPRITDEGIPGLIIHNLGNSDLGPELTTGSELGFDLSALGERVRLGFTRYSQRTEDVLIRVHEAPSFGTAEATLRNLGETQGSGVEATLDVAVLRGGLFDWSLSGSYATNNSRVTDLGPLENQPEGVRLGQPLHVATGDVVANPGAVGALPTYRREALGPLWPTKLFSVGSRVSFDGALTLDVLGEGHLGHVRTVGVGASAARVGAWPGCRGILDRFESSGIIALTTQQIATCVPLHITDGMWTDRADFFRLRSVSMSYRIPPDLLPAAPDVVISLQAKHLLTITDYQGLDPEAIDRGFATEVPVEIFNLPPPRTFIVRVRVGF